MKEIIFSGNSWADYTYWQGQDKKTLRKINALIQDIDRNGNNGTGKPEPLVGNLSGWWSRRIDLSRWGAYPLTLRPLASGSAAE
ncbi:MAG: hypothetical protein Ta2A_02240 [Treponemataceae bacterium]|nr:MAG: hypothetical protein Ta2A_02240 [Treponemataceae bacterium]